MAWKLDTVVLPTDTVWSNEIEESQVLQELSFTLAGSLLIEESLKNTGRPITLDLSGIPRSTLLSLHELAATAATAHTLELHDGRHWQVVFQRPNPIEATPYVDFATGDLDGTELYTTILKLIRIDGWS